MAAGRLLPRDGRLRTQYAMRQPQLRRVRKNTLSDDYTHQRIAVDSCGLTGVMRFLSRRLSTSHLAPAAINSPLPPTSIPFSKEDAL